VTAPLDPRLADLLIRLANLDNDKYVTFHPYFAGGEIEADLIGYEGEKVPEGPTKELDRLGLIEMEREGGKRLGKFWLTKEGRSLAVELMSTANRPVDLSWPSVEPVLRQIHEVWKGEGAPPLGIPASGVLVGIALPMQAPEFMAILNALRDDEWVDFRQGLGPPLPQGLRPTRRTLAFYEGWPTNDPRVAGEQFVALLEERVEAEPDPEKRSKLRAAFETGGSAFKDLSVEVAAAIISRQIGAG
jgi:hypothetical protein